MIRAAVLGADVSKSRSPAIHNAAYAAMGVDGRYEAISVGAGGFTARAAQLFVEGYRYLNVTIPHKAAAYELAAYHGEEAHHSGAVNTLVFDPERGVVWGHNTDGAGLLAALRDLSVPVGSPLRVVMAGAGGAAAGGIEALSRAGARVQVVARRPEAALAIQRRLPHHQAARVTVAPWTADELARAVDGADVIVSAVPAAAWADDAVRAGLRPMAADTAVLEMAYAPDDTPLARAARAATARYADGLGMLVHQAARAVELALGHAPPLPPLFRAARGG
jgi:shikimate dehydrogenase